MHICKPEASPLVFVRQPFVVDAEQMEQRGLQVVHVHRVLYDVVAEVVGLPVGQSSLDAAAGLSAAKRCFSVRYNASSSVSCGALGQEPINRRKASFISTTFS